MKAQMTQIIFLNEKLINIWVKPILECELELIILQRWNFFMDLKFKTVSIRLFLERKLQKI